jgi:hypothetical protein
MKIEKIRIEKIKHETNINQKKSKNAKTIKKGSRGALCTGFTGMDGLFPTITGTH